MWILKNSKDLLDYLKSQSLSQIYQIKTFDFLTLYTTIPHDKLKERLKDLLHNAFYKKNGNRRYKYIAITKQRVYFVKNHTDTKKHYSEEEIYNMLAFLIDNIFVEFAGQIFRQTIGIPMGTNCAPLLADLFLYSYEADFIQTLLSRKQKKLAQKFNFTYRYIDDVLSINNPEFINNIVQIYPTELEIKDTTESANSASYLDLLLTTNIDGKLVTKIYDKRDDFRFPIINFPFLDSNIPSLPAYGVYISQLVRYSRACSEKCDFVTRAEILTSKLLNQGYCELKLKKIFKKFYGRYHDKIDRYETSVTSFLSDIFPT